MLKACILFSAACLFAIGSYVMFKPDLSDLGFIPVVATNPETASEFRSLFAGSFLAYGYLLVRYIYSFRLRLYRANHSVHYGLYCHWQACELFL
jgi:hypothetical protein